RAGSGGGGPGKPGRAGVQGGEGAARPVLGGKGRGGGGLPRPFSWGAAGGVAPPAFTSRSPGGRCGAAINPYCTAPIKRVGGPSGPTWVGISPTTHTPAFTWPADQYALTLALWERFYQPSSGGGGPRLRCPARPPPR